MAAAGKAYSQCVIYQIFFINILVIFFQIAVI